MQRIAEAVSLVVCKGRWQGLDLEVKKLLPGILSWLQTKLHHTLMSDARIAVARHMENFIVFGLVHRGLGDSSIT